MTTAPAAPMTSVAPASALPTVSVLLPAWNEARMIARCLDSLLAIDWPGLEMIVCAGGGDATLDIARSYESERVIVLEQRSGEGKQAALRRCFAASRGEIIYLTDADCVVPQEAFVEVVKPIVDGCVDAATGLSLPLLEQRSNPLVRYQWGKDLAGTHRHGPFAHGVHGRNSAIQRNVIDRLAPFEPPVPSGTDFHLGQALRIAGVKIAWAPSFVFSEYPETPAEYVRMWRRWVKNVLVQGILSGSWTEVRTTGLGVGSSLILIGAPLLAPVLGRRVLIPWLALSAWVARKRFVAHRLEQTAGRVPEIQQPLIRFPAYVLLDSLGAVAGLVAAVVPSMRRAW